MSSRFFLAALLIGIAYGQNAGVDSALTPIDPNEKPEPYQKILEGDPRNSLAHYRLAEIYMAGRNFQSAANEFREALNGDLKPKGIEASAHLNLGKIFQITNQPERAVHEFNLARQAGETDQPPLLNGTPVRLEPWIFTEPIVVAESTDPITPEYSDEARRAGLEGTVQLSGWIGPDGKARYLRVSRGLGLGLDDKAVLAVERARFKTETFAGEPQAAAAVFLVDFLLPENRSRWHLVGARCTPPEGVGRPTFRSAPYPGGAGISAGGDAIDEGQILGAVGRFARVSIAMDVSAQGTPVNLSVREASYPVWGPEAMAVLSHWNFAAGRSAGLGAKPVAVPCVLDFVWGPRLLTAGMLAAVRSNDHQSVLPIDYEVAEANFPAQPAAGKTLVLSGYIKHDAGSRGWSGLWAFVDGHMLTSQPDIQPDADGWTLHQITIRVPNDVRSKRIVFGGLTAGDGTTWFDDFGITLDGAPYDGVGKLDLDFETPDASGFQIRGGSYQVKTDREIYRRGKQSLRLLYQGGGQ